MEEVLSREKWCWDLKGKGMEGIRLEEGWGGMREKGRIGEEGKECVRMEGEEGKA